MISTIQVHKEFKDELNTFRISSKESYETILRRIIVQAKKQDTSYHDLMREGCLEMADESIKITEEFVHADAEHLPDY